MIEGAPSQSIGRTAHGGDQKWDKQSHISISGSVEGGGSVPSLRV